MPSLFSGNDEWDRAFVEAMTKAASTPPEQMESEIDRIRADIGKLLDKWKPERNPPEEVKTLLRALAFFADSTISLFMAATGFIALAYTIGKEHGRLSLWTEEDGPQEREEPEL